MLSALTLNTQLVNTLSLSLSLPILSLSLPIEIQTLLSLSHSFMNCLTLTVAAVGLIATSVLGFVMPTRQRWQKGEDRSTSLGVGAAFTHVLTNEWSKDQDLFVLQ